MGFEVVNNSQNILTWSSTSCQCAFGSPPKAVNCCRKIDIVFRLRRWLSISDEKPKATLLSNQAIITYPDSPEVETTFFFKIGDKNKEDTSFVETNELPSGQKEREYYTNLHMNNSPSETSFTFIPTTVSDLSEDNSYNRNHMEGSEKVRKNVIESVVELTYPIKTYFKEESREKYSIRKTAKLSTDSENSDYENNVSTKLKPKDGEEDSEMENGKESVITKKHKRSKHNSGLLERRRSRTESKDENTDDELENVGIFGACTSKKALSYEVRHKKNSKSKSLLKENDSNELKAKTDILEVSDKIGSNFLGEHVAEISGGNIKALNSPKCISRRNKKASKVSKEDKCVNETKCISYNYCCSAENEELIPNQEMTVNVFVPTTRKIFSPVRKDSKGETSTVISYVVEEPESSCQPNNCIPKPYEIYGKLKKSETLKTISNMEEKSDKHKEVTIINRDETEVESKKEAKQKFDFIMPPCWIIKQARAQSASPALQRRTIQNSWSKAKITDNEFHDKASISTENENKISEATKTENNKTSSSNIFEDKKEIKSNESDSINQNIYLTDHLSQKECILKDACRKNSSSSESVENNRPLRKEGSSIPSSLKLRSEAGFPPISPLTVRREMKVLKETAPSIRMMIAKYNQKVHESQELSGTKSPESGGQSPIAWRSPVTERRIKAQMEKYQEEVRKALQNSSRKDFYANTRLGQVQKSASAGYIRPFDKGCSNESINERSEEKYLSQTSKYHGILKSSSAGAIKSFSPLSARKNQIKHSDVALHKDCSSALTINTETSPANSRIRIEEIYFQPTEKIKKSINCDNIGTSIEKEEIKVAHIPPIPMVLNDDISNIFEPDHSPESTRVRALKIKKAKEEFLLRGCVRGTSKTDTSGVQNCPNTPDTPIQHERLSWTDSKSRLSQVSCGSESSYENVPMILVSGKEPSRDHNGTLLVKSASAGMINIDSTACSSVFSGAPNTAETSDKAIIPKSKSGILSRFRKARLKRNKEKDNPKLDTVSTLCRQSLVVDIDHRNKNGADPLPSTSKSCPSSPVLHKKDQTTSAKWIRNPKRIFKPK